MEEARKSKYNRTMADKGWSWVVLAGISFWNLLITGTIKSSGFIYLDYLNLYDEDPTITSWIGASFNLVLSIIAPLAGHLLDGRSHSCRRFGIAFGAFVAVGGFIGAAFSHNVIQTIMTFGVISGFATAIFDPILLSFLGVYFVERRVIASSVSFTGSSMGGLIIPPLMAWISGVYGARGMMLILAGIWCHIVIIAAVCRPVSHQVADNRVQHQRSTSANVSGGVGKALISVISVDMPSTIVSTSSCIGLPLQHVAQNDETQVDKKSVCSEGTQVSVGLNIDLPFSTTASETPIRVLPLTANTAGQVNVSTSAQLKTTETSSNKHPSAQFGCFYQLKSYCQFLATHKFPLLLVIIMLSSKSYFLTFFILPPLIEEAGLGKQFAARIFMIIGLIEICCRPIVGVIGEKIGPRKTIILLLCQSVSALAGFATCFWSLSATSLTVYAVIFGVFGGAFAPLIIPLLLEYAPDNRKTAAAGLFPFLVGIGPTAGAPLISVLKEYTGTYIYGLVFLSTSYALAFPLTVIWCQPCNIKANRKDSYTLDGRMNEGYQ